MALFPKVVFGCSDGTGLTVKVPYTEAVKLAVIGLYFPDVPT